MLEAVGSFLESLIDSIARFPQAVLEGLSSIHLGRLGNLADYRWLAIMGIVVLVVILTYRDRKNY